MGTNFGRILITGSTGMLGQYVMNYLSVAGAMDIYAPVRAECDLVKPRSSYDKIIEIRPDIILHLGAETDVDLCERDPERAGIINHLSTGAIARGASEVGAWLLYISTSNVFGGAQRLIYNELDVPSPINYYGRSKYYGELEVRGRLPNDHLILRAGWMIGGGRDHDHKFVGKIIQQIHGNAEELKAVTDRYGTITSADSLAAFIVSSLQRRPTGTFHFSSLGLTTRFDVAKAVAETLRFKGKLIGVPSALFPQSAPRPQSEGIESIYASVNGISFRSWHEDLASYLSEFI